MPSCGPHSAIHSAVVVIYLSRGAPIRPSHLDPAEQSEASQDSGQTFSTGPRRPIALWTLHGNAFTRPFPGTERQRSRAQLVVGSGSLIKPKLPQLARTGHGTSTGNVLTWGLVRSTRPSKVMAREWRSLPRSATIRTQRASGRLTKLTYMPHKDPTIRAGCAQQRKKQSTPHPFAFISRSHSVCGQSEFEVSRWPYRGCPRSQRLVIGKAGRPYLSSCTVDG